jgi:hypothetical protein
MTEWKSLRNSWPELPGKYAVRDICFNLQGTAHFDGWNFEAPHWINAPEDVLPYIVNSVTHWKEL